MVNRLISIDTAKSPGVQLPDPVITEIEQLVNVLPEIHQDFATKGTGEVSLTTDSGHDVALLGSRVASYPPAIVSGRLINPDNTAGATSSFYEVVADSFITYMMMEFDLGVAGSTNGGYAGLLAYNTALPQVAGVVSTPMPNSPCEILFYNNHYDITARLGASVYALGSVSYGVTFANAATQHVEVVIDTANEMVHVRGADGVVTGFTYAGHAIGGAGNDVGPLAVVVQAGSTVGNTDHRGQVKRFVADTTPLYNSANPAYGPANTLLLTGQMILGLGLGNLAINTLSSTATSGGTKTLSISDETIQVFTGATTHTLKLSTTSVVAGKTYTVVNLSTGAVTVQSSGANTILIVAAGCSANFTALVNTPTTAANWNGRYNGAIVASGKKLSVSNTITLAGTDGTTMTFPTTTDTVAGLAEAQTFTNKRITPRIGTTTSSSTPTADADAHDQYNVTALAAGATFGAPTGSPVNGQKLLYRIKDNGGAQTLAYNIIFRAVGVTLPLVTVAGKTLYIGTIYNAVGPKWDVVAVAQEA